MLEDKFFNTVKEYRMLAPGDKVLVAVSGGADSTALLNLLCAHRKKLGIDLHVAHLNHLIRRQDAEMDMRFVQGLAQNLKVPITVENCDVPELAKRERLGLEAAARQARYDFFARTAKNVGANRIAVGHTADDNVETFLMRLLRGTGIRGLCGIPPVRGNIIRPLIKIWRREVEDYVGSLKLVPRRDYTNYESKFMRNRVRMKLIPQLKIYNLNIKEIILQTILLLTDDYEYLDIKAEDALLQLIVAEDEGEIKLDPAKLGNMEPTIRGHVLRKAIERIKGDLTNLTYKHIRDVLENMEEKEKWEIHLPAGLSVSGGRDRLAISRKRTETPQKKSYRYTLAIPGEIEIRELGKRVRAELVEGSDAGKVSKNPRIALVEYSALGRNLVVRSRLDGDRFCPLGMKGTKKLQDFFVDEKIAAEERDAVPVVESGGRIVWVAGMRLDDRAKVNDKTRKAVRIELL